jgi:hypothetical protein
MLVDRAIAVTRSIPPDEPQLAGYRLASALSVVENDPRTGLDVWATDVSAKISEEDVKRLRNLGNIAREVQLREYERALERDHRRYLREEVLTSTGSALVWWLARHLNEIDGAVAQIPALARISAVAQDRVEPDYIDSSPGAGVPGADAWFVDERPAPSGDPEPVDIPTGAPNRTVATNARDLLVALFPCDDAGRLTAGRQLAALADRWDRGEFARAIRDEIGRPSWGEPVTATNGSVAGRGAANVSNAEAAGTMGADAVTTDDDSSGPPSGDPPQL